MSDDTKYEPKFGYDIRIKPPGRKKREPEQSTRVCEWPGCEAKAQHKAPKSRAEPGSYRWFCLEHVKEYNRNWNFFDGLSDEEAAVMREKNSLGDRPTWAFGSLGSAGDGRRTHAEGAGARPSGEGWQRGRPFTSASRVRKEPEKSRRQLTKRQAKAFDVFQLPQSASRADIRTQYKELVKRFHPDTNGGDRSFEARLREVIEAYQVLKSSGFC